MATGTLSGAAGQLGDILGEGLSRQLQSFDRREVGEDCLRELLDREPALDRERRRLNTVAAFGPQDVRTEQLPGAGVRNEFDEATRIARGDGPRDVIERENGDFYLKALPSRRRFRQADTGDLRIGEHDPGMAVAS